MLKWPHYHQRARGKKLDWKQLGAVCQARKPLYAYSKHRLHYDQSKAVHSVHQIDVLKNNQYQQLLGVSYIKH